MFQQYLKKRLFASEWRKGNKNSIYENCDKQSEKIYRSVSLLSGWDIRYSNSYCFIKCTHFFTENELVSIIELILVLY